MIGPLGRPIGNQIANLIANRPDPEGTPDNLPHKYVVLIGVRGLHRFCILAALGPFRAVFLYGQVAQHR